MALADYEQALVELHKLVSKGSGEYADLLTRTEPLDRSLPEGHYFVSNYTDPALEQSSDQITVSHKALQELSDRGLLRFPFLNEGQRNPFGLSSTGMKLAKQLQTE